MSKKHFEKLAVMVASIKDQAEKQQMTERMVEFCQEMNPNFSRFKFMEAVNDLSQGVRPSGFSKATFEQARLA